MLLDKVTMDCNITIYKYHKYQLMISGPDIYWQDLIAFSIVIANIYNLHVTKLYCMTSSVWY